MPVTTSQSPARLAEPQPMAQNPGEPAALGSERPGSARARGSVALLLRLPGDPGVPPLLTPDKSISLRARQEASRGAGCLLDRDPQGRAQRGHCPFPTVTTGARKPHGRDKPADRVPRALMRQQHEPLWASGPALSPKPRAQESARSLRSRRASMVSLERSLEQSREQSLGSRIPNPGEASRCKGGMRGPQSGALCGSWSVWAMTGTTGRGAELEDPVGLGCAVSSCTWWTGRC